MGSDLIVPPSAERWIRLQRTGIPASAYGETMAEEFAELAPRLPPHASSIVEVGPGAGGLAVFLARHYPRVRLCLVERSASPRHIPYGYGDRSFYASIDACRELLDANGIDAERVRFQDPSEGLPAADVVISLLAWGFHLPVEDYLERIRLSPGGRIILDLRAGTGGRAAMAERFEEVGTVRRSGKYERVVWQ